MLYKILSLYLFFYFLMPIISYGNINDDINKIISSKGMPLKNVGVVAFDVKKSTLLFDLNSNTPFIPASVAKLFTAILALETLGDTHRFKTTVGYTGKIKNMILDGDVFLIGGGDPLLLTADLNDFVMSIKELGIKSVKGQFIYVDDQFPISTVINEKGEIDKTDNPGVGPLSCNFNRFSYYQQSRGILKKSINLDSISLVGVTKRPAPHDEFISVKRGETREWHYYKNKRYRNGELPVKEPGIYTAELFRYLAKMQGVDLPAPIRGKVSQNVKVIFEKKSHPMKDIIKGMFEYSNNLIAEMVFQNSLTRVKMSSMLEWFKSHYPSIKWTNVNFFNGSGHSFDTQITAVSLGQLLQKVHNRRVGNSYFSNLLSISGQTGWMRKRLYSDTIGPRVWAKTGTIDYASSIAGYFYGNSGEKRAFVILINDRIKRKLLTEKKDFKNLARGAAPWKRKSRELQDQILEKLINKF